jgi:hypothetical protein
MGFQNDKGALFEQIGVFNVITGLPKTKKPNSMESIASTSKNLLPFFLDLLAASCLDKAKSPKDAARCSGNRILLGVLTEFLPRLIQIVKEGVIKGIKAGLACGTDFTIPSPTPVFTVPIDKLDLTGMMKMDPNGPAGLLFGDPTRDFNAFLLDIIVNQSNGTWDDKSGRALMVITYNLPTPATNNLPTVTIKVADGSTNYNRGGTSFHDFLIDYINSVEMFSIKNIMGTIMEQSFGSISLANNIGADTLLANAKMDKGVEKILDVDVCADKLVIDDSFYAFSNEELTNMERDANNKSRGINVMDLGCGLVEIPLPEDILEPLKDLDTATPTQIKDILEQTLESTGKAIEDSGDDTDGPTMKANFSVSSVVAFPQTLMRMVITPKIVTLYQVSHKCVNDITLDVSDGYDFSKSSRTFFDYVARESLAALLEILFNQIKRELIALVAKVVIKIIKEKIKIFINSMSGGRATDAISGGVDNIEPPDTGNLI